MCEKAGFAVEKLEKQKGNRMHLVARKRQRRLLNRPKYYASKNRIEKATEEQLTLR